MLISDPLVFIELQKTGSTHIKGLLKKIVGGTNDGKHNVPTAELLAAGKPFIGSVRDPWSWYLSLWSYGCLQKGELYERLTNPKKWRKLLEKGEGEGEGEGTDDDAADEPAADETASEAGAAPAKADAGKGKGKTLPPEFTPERAKSFWYADPDNAEAFREWLRAVLAVQPLRKVLEAGYGKSPVSKLGGLMTFRYFTLFTRGGEQIDKSVATHEALKKYDADNCFVAHFVRNESLAEDLIKAIEGCGVALGDEQLQMIRGAKKTNVSNRPHGPEHYYDAASTQLVARRERFIIEKFGYKDKKP